MAKKVKFKPQVKRTSIKQYLNEVRLELKKVAWPNRQELMLSTVIVIFVVVVFAILTGLLDLGFATLLKVVSFR